MDKLGQRPMLVVRDHHHVANGGFLILGRKPYESEVRKSPSFLAAILGRTHAPFLSSSLGIDREWTKGSDDALNKICICTTLVILATLFWPPIYALHGFAVRAIQCKVVLLFS